GAAFVANLPVTNNDTIIVLSIGKSSNGGSTIVQLTNNNDQLTCTGGSNASTTQPGQGGYVLCSNEDNYKTLYATYCFEGQSGNKYNGGNSYGAGSSVFNDFNCFKGGGGAPNQNGADGIVELFYFQPVLNM